MALAGNSTRLSSHDLQRIALSHCRLVVHGFCPNCVIFVLLFVPAIQLFRTYGTNSQLIPCNSRTILSIAGTSSAFLVILQCRT